MANAVKRSVLVTRNSESWSSQGQLTLPDQAIQLNLRPHQVPVVADPVRFMVLLAHRRFGKTVGAVARAVMASRQCQYTAPKVHYFAPTAKQAKRVAWMYAKELCAPLAGVRFSETECTVFLPWNGATLQLGGADDPDASRGIYSDFAVLDEPAQMQARFWSEVIRPALSDRQGGGLFIGTPKGRHGVFYDNYQYAATSGDPEWKALCFKASETGLIAPHELASARRTMTQAEYDQEYECSWDAAIRGAYWAESIQRIEAAGQIHDRFVHDPREQVHVVMDLGFNDATACWFVQLQGNAVVVIDYAEYTNRALPEIVADWKLRPYTYGKVVAPHDVGVHELSTGHTRAYTLMQLGLDVVVAPRLAVADGIEAVRMLLPRCFFNATRCAPGLEALRQYRADWEDQKGVLSLRPVHDWTSHGADAFRYLAVTGLHMLQPWGGDIDYSRMDRSRCA